MTDKWSMVGWQGVSLRTPPDWHLAGVSGDEKKGYFRVLSPGTAAIEVRWESAKQAPNVDNRVDAFLSAMKAAAKKKKLSFSSRINARKPTAAEEAHGGDSVGFTWKSDQRAYGRMLYCGYCKRLVIGQVVCGPKEDLSGLSSRALGSLCEHEMPGLNIWALYDLVVPVPQNMQLRRQSLMSSFVELEFVGRGERLVVQRWGLAANTLLKKRSLIEWVTQSYLPGVQGYMAVLKPVEGEHDELALEGRRLGIRRALMSLPMALAGRPIPRMLGGRVWYCEESNRIYAVRHYHGGNSEMVGALRAKIACH